jgi:hypothetical protein
VRNREASPTRTAFSAAWSARSVLRLGGPTADGPRIGYRPRPDATPEDEARVLAGVYAFLIERAEREKAAGAERDVEGAGREDA